MIVGFGHIARSGKDTAADTLVAAGFQRVSFADPVRAVAKATSPRLAHLVDQVGWEGAKRHMDTRPILEAVGSSLRRELGADILVKHAIRHMDRSRHAVITDVRYPDEVEALRALEAVLIRIDRPGVRPQGPSDQHLMGYAGWDAVVVNDGTTEDLHGNIRRLIEV